MRKFKTESQKLLDLMINSIYTNREIFLRELVSNGSDAVDKLYLKSLTDADAVVAKDSLGISITADKDARTITISDTGIGMSKDELDKNLSTIAHSGSQEFKEANAKEQGKDIDIIGQFGVGFYSAFMVARNVKVVSRAYGSDEAWMWESNGTEGYEIKPASRDTWGTDVILTLKDDTADDRYSEFLEESRIKALVRKYSNYVRYPIRLVEAKDGDEPGEPKTEVINSMVPIWKRKKSEVSQEDYDEFFKSNFHETEAPLRCISVHAEGALSYDALLFIPAKTAWNYYDREFKKGLALYSSGVMIMEKCEELLPDCFGFVKGVVDSQDLSLNISRETLQHNNQLKAIARRLEKKIKSELVALRDDEREKYEAFFEQFGRAIKFGIYSSFGEKKELLEDLLMFHSARKGKLITLAEYIEDAPADQKSIYYAAGNDLDRVSKLPMVTTVVSKGYDVLLCTMDVDEFCLLGVRDYYGKPFRNVSSGNLDVESEAEIDAAEALDTENAELFAALKEALGESIDKVRSSTRITDAPCCLVSDGPLSLEMERILANEPGADPKMFKTVHILELSPSHPVFAALQTAQEAGDADKIARYAKLLYNQARLIEGLPIEDPIAFARDIAALMQ